MRGIVTIVAAVCLLVAGGARPDLARAGGGAATQVEAPSPGHTKCVKARRGEARSSLRLPAFTLPAVAAVPPLRRVGIVRSSQHRRADAGTRPPAPASRGPPRG